ncbi:ArsR/SmtB family transcription factor [Cellulosimicrobium cellulans]|uniref:HTH arsR-type domain-containing protein n=1 Tax=Cellulosimicrobium cellulans TaxID=1710 RepID=A0A4Y4E2Y5_CELCE|nr:helix-turn-helix domain-containing protein [Cellulosimicrobium cellulans]GED11337.1 hypothetical protein CCE02nite_33360 [Cellulosimicrobium cellulans]
MPYKSPDDDLDSLGQIARSDDRIAVVRHLRKKPAENYFGAIQKGTGIATGSLGKHLRELEAAGVIQGDLPQQERHGRYVRYQLDDKRVRQLLKKFERVLLG